MKNLANRDEKRVLDKILRERRLKGLSIGETWALFSSIKKDHVFKRKKQKEPITVKFDDKEIALLKQLKMKVRDSLESSSSKRCSYCRRVMGNYSYSWQIEHIRCKDKHDTEAFDMGNLALACVDCNVWKGKTVDKSNPYIYDIINPNLKGFLYSKHLRFFHLSTEEVCLLRYRHLSEEGKKTYEYLRLNVWERAETIKSLSSTHAETSSRLERILDVLSHENLNTEMAQLLAELKVLAFQR